MFEGGPDIWSWLPNSGSKTDSGSIPAKGSESMTKQLKKAGLSSGLKPAKDADPLAVRNILDASGLEKRDACLLQAWIFGAHDANDIGISFELFGQTIGSEGFGATSAALSAQSVCADYITFGDKFWGRDSIESAVDNLRKIDNEAADLIESVGNAKAKASAKKQNVEAEKDAEKIRQNALSVVKTGAISVGTIAALAIVGYIAFMVATTKRG